MQDVIHGAIKAPHKVHLDFIFNVLRNLSGEQIYSHSVPL